MNIGFIGLGRLGLPVALAFASRGNVVNGYEIHTERRAAYQRGASGLYEPDIDSFLKRFLEGGVAGTDAEKALKLTPTISGSVEPSAIVFIAVQTPSQPDDSFDTSYVAFAVEAVADAIHRLDDGKRRTIALISTVLPGTCRAEFLPLLRQHIAAEQYKFCCNAQFIGMGSVVQNTLNPEFVLIGEENEDDGSELVEFYQETLGATVPIVRTSLENAEVIKMVYNVMVGLKIAYGNTIMQLCDVLPHADCDVVVRALSLAQDRLISPKYLRGGMPDAGPCHPRDQRALAYLSQSLHLDRGVFEFLVDSRRQQIRWLSRQIAYAHNKDGRHLPIKFLGVSFKPNTDLTDDSTALALEDHLRKVYGLKTIEKYDPAVSPFTTTMGVEDSPRLYVIATEWPELVDYPFASGSVIVDPWGLLKAAPEECTLVALGRER